LVTNGNFGEVQWEAATIPTVVISTTAIPTATILTNVILTEIDVDRQVITLYIYIH